MLKSILRQAGICLIVAVLMACSSPEEKAASYIENGGVLFAEGNLEKAEIEYKNALQVNQNLPDAWLGLARIYDSRRDWEKTYSALKKIRELAPDHLEGRLMMGQLLASTNLLDQTLAEARDILELAPNDARAHALMAAVQYRLGNYEGARQEVDMALVLDAGNAAALLVRARVLMAEKRYDEALSGLDQAIQKDRENPLFYQMKIQVYAEKDDQPAIEKAYLTLIDQFPDRVEFKQSLVRHYIEARNIDSAERILQQIAESGGRNVDQNLRFVAFKLQYRSPDEAIALVKSYIDDDEKEYRYRFRLGELYEKTGRVDKARSVYETIIADDGTQSNGLEARNQISLIELRQGNLDRATQFNSEVLAQDKNNENALLIRAGFQLIDQNYDEAIVGARTVLRNNPDSTRALALLGQAYEASGSQELAIEAYTGAFQLNPGSPEIANKLAANLLIQRKAARADEVLQRSLKNGNDSVDSIRLLTQTKLALGEWDTAEQLARQLQKFAGQESVSQQLLGVAYMGMNRKDDSIEAFKRAHELAPDSAEPVAALVKTYISSGKVDEAKQFLNSILEVDGSNYTAHMLLGEISLATDATSEAIIHFSGAIKSDPGQVDGYRRLAFAYSVRNEMDKAEETIKKAMVAIPDRSELAIHLAAIYEKNGEYEKAIDVYKAVVEKDDNALIAKNNLAGLLTDHRNDQASFDLARTISTALKDSQIPQFRDTYAWASVMAGSNLEEAVVILEGLVRENDKVDIYAYHLGEAYRRKGDSKNAITWLDKAADLAGADSNIASKARQSLQQIQ